jgi:uncharacterized protein (TIGR00369 family)
MLGPAEVRERAERALDVPLLSFLGTSLLDPDDPTAGLRFELGPNVLNAVDILHGGVISTVLDLAAYLAVLSELDVDEEATTHALAVQFVARAKSPAPPGHRTGRAKDTSAGLRLCRAPGSRAPGGSGPGHQVGLPLAIAAGPSPGG